MGGFTDAVPEFQHVRDKPLLCLTGFASHSVTHLGLARRSTRAGTGLRKLVLFDVVPLTAPIPREAIARRTAPKMRHRVERHLQRGGLLPPATGDAIVDAISLART